MDSLIYLDAAASSPLAPEAFTATVDALGAVGNPGASHVAGAAAARLIENAREKVARLANANPASVVFTGSATEANNLALRGLCISGTREQLVSTTAEHPSVGVTLSELEATGRRVVRVGLRATGAVDLDALDTAITDKTLVVSVHAANNETGVVQPLREIVAFAHSRGALVHADASQLMAWGSSPLLDECDMVTISSHKMHGPPGAAALIVRADARRRLRPQMSGGGQEHGFRSGTLNVPAIAGFGAAALLASEAGPDAAARTKALRADLIAGLRSRIPQIREHGEAADARLPGILNVAVGAMLPESVESEALLARIPELAASTGSACHSGAPGPSPVLLAMGVSEWEAARSIRLSLSRYTTATDVARAIDALSAGYADLMRLLGADDSEVRYVR